MRLAKQLQGNQENTRLFAYSYQNIAAMTEAHVQIERKENVILVCQKSFDNNNKDSDICEFCRYTHRITSH